MGLGNIRGFSIRILEKIKKKVIFVDESNIVQMIKNRCLVYSRWIYALFSRLDPWGDYRINVVITFYKAGDRGHAWVTRNECDFLLPNPTVIRSKLLEVADDGVYRYFVKESNVDRYYQGY